MPIVAGAGVSYSPLLYRPRESWAPLSQHLRNGATQPKSAAEESEAVLDEYARRMATGNDAIRSALAGGRLDALMVLTADRGSQFDESHVPQFHVQVGGAVWGDPAIAELGEAARRQEFECDEGFADLLIEELARAKFDVAEGRSAFRPAGDPQRGLTPAAVEAIASFSQGVPIVPISVNCHVAPQASGRRIHQFGKTIARAAGLSARRIGLLVSGGLSGDPRGRMSGWVDDVFDRWALRRLERGGSDDLARVWDAKSRTLKGGTAEVRLWTAAAAAFDHVGLRATVHDYMPIHAAAAGVAFVSWEG